MSQVSELCATRRAAALLTATLLIALSSCKTPTRREPAYAAPDEAMVAQIAAANATLGVNDVLEIRVYQESDLTGIFRVSAEGTIDYPFCGRVKAALLTSSALADQLTRCLENGYLKNPQVTVFLKEYNSKKIFVFGEVQKPGTFPFEDKMSIVQAITLAGGFGKLAAKNSVIVTRLVDGEERKFKVPVEGIAEGRDKNFALQPGDIVYIPESFL
ncbi:MAG TPA: polysaccharide biosynthesis protein [Myxococcales bacterium]|jgi:polysaccharide export outer membrane protein|nr:polysaccharide biosynthesis protein [Myxococcales bacterium]